MEKCYTENRNLGRFIANVGNDWRNSMYITCSVCKFRKEECCDDLLVSFSHNGYPTLITAKDAGKVYGLIIDKSECMAEISNMKFLELYKNYIRNKAGSYSNGRQYKCPLLKAAETTSRALHIEDMFIIPKATK